MHLEQEKHFPTRKEVLDRIKQIPLGQSPSSDPCKKLIVESLTDLEQHILRKAYEVEIVVLTSRLEAGTIVASLKEMHAAPPKDFEHMITHSQKKRMKTKLLTLKSLLNNNPLRDSEQRRRKIRPTKELAKIELRKREASHPRGY